MGRRVRKPFPQASRQVQALGERLRHARLRRNLTTVIFAERMGVSRDTLHRLEKGDPGISLGTYLRALRVLGLDLDLDLIAWGNEVRNTPTLTLPHPRAHLRRFVLQPLSELAPDLVLPGQTQTVAELLVPTMRSDRRCTLSTMRKSSAASLKVRSATVPENSVSSSSLISVKR